MGMQTDMKLGVGLCQHGSLKVGDFMRNIRRENDAAVCNACNQVVATYYTGEDPDKHIRG